MSAHTRTLRVTRREVEHTRASLSGLTRTQEGLARPLEPCVGKRKPGESLVTGVAAVKVVTVLSEAVALARQLVSETARTNISERGRDRVTLA